MSWLIALIILVAILPFIFLNPKKLLLFSIIPWWAWWGLPEEERGGGLFDNSLYSVLMAIYKRISSRKRALKAAKPFLKRYKKIFGDMTLSNQRCQISIMMTKQKQLQILCISKIADDTTGKKPVFTAEAMSEKNENGSMELFWNQVCLNFSALTNYESFLNDCKLRMLYIVEQHISTATNKPKTEQKKVEQNQKPREEITDTQQHIDEPHNNSESKRIRNSSRIVDF